MNIKPRVFRCLVAVAVAFATALLTPALAARGTSGSGSTATIEIIDVGQGDSILIQSPEGKTALIDAGPSNAVVESLKAKGIQSIDLVAVSHHHSDHYGGMRQVILNFHPTYYLATNSKHTTSSYLKLLKTVQEAGVQAVGPLPKKPRRIELGSVVITVFPQPPLNDQEENENSIGMRVQYGDFSMILTGDSEERERAWWVKNYPQLLENATVLKLAHHGSRNGTDAKWLDLIAPELTVASLGKGNSFGHPHSETVQLLRQKGVPLKRTDREGSILLMTDGKRWRQSREELALRPSSSSRSSRSASASTR